MIRGGCASLEDKGKAHLERPRASLGDGGITGVSLLSRMKGLNYLGTDGCRVSLVDEGGGAAHLFQELRDNVRLSGTEGGRASLRDGGVVHLSWGQRHYAPHSGTEVW